MTMMMMMMTGAVSQVVATARQFVANSEGTTAMEYALIAAFISVAIVGVVAVLGSNVAALYNFVASALGG